MERDLANTKHARALECAWSVEIVSDEALRTGAEFMSGFSKNLKCFVRVDNDFSVIFLITVTLSYALNHENPPNMKKNDQHCHQFKLTRSFFIRGDVRVFQWIDWCLILQNPCFITGEISISVYLKRYGRTGSLLLTCAIRILLLLKLDTKSI